MGTSRLREGVKNLAGRARPLQSNSFVGSGMSDLFPEL
jgi:hypothetical protein